MGSLSTFAIASRGAEDRAVGLAIARAQIARIKAAPYQVSGDYSSYYEALPAGYSRSVSVSWWDGISAWSGTQNANGLQLLVVTIADDGAPAASVEFVKASR